MAEVKNLLIIVNSGADKPYNHYAAYGIASMGMQVGKIETVTLYYGPYGTGMTRKGELAKLAIQRSVKELLVSQIARLSASDLPDKIHYLWEHAVALPTGYIDWRKNYVNGGASKGGHGGSIGACRQT